MSAPLLRGGAVLDTAAGWLRRADVLVQGDRIAAVAPGLAPPAGARVVDLAGRTVMPGLIDCHVHVCADGMVPYPTLFPSLVAARTARLLQETLLRGFATIRDMGGADAGCAAPSGTACSPARACSSPAVRSARRAAMATCGTRPMGALPARSAPRRT